VTRALCAGALALLLTACASRILTDAANGVRHDLAVRAISSLDSAYVESPPAAGLVLCGEIAVEPPSLASLGTRGVGQARSFAAYVSAASLAGEEAALPYASFYARYGSDCACLARIEGLRAVGVGAAAGEPGVTLVDPGGVPRGQVTLEQQTLRVDALPGVTLRPVDLRLGPRGRSPGYWALLPLGLVWDGTFLAASVAVGTPLYALSWVAQRVASLGSSAPAPPAQPEPPRDPCAGITWWYSPGGPRQE
jgi:hypothetical protein